MTTEIAVRAEGSKCDRPQMTQINADKFKTNVIIFCSSALICVICG